MADENQIAGRAKLEQEKRDHATWHRSALEMRTPGGRPVLPFLLTGVPIPGSDGKAVTPNIDFCGMDHWTYAFMVALQGVATKKTGVEQAVERAEKIADLAMQALEKHWVEAAHAVAAAARRVGPMEEPNADA